MTSRTINGTLELKLEYYRKLYCQYIDLKIDRCIDTKEVWNPSIESNPVDVIIADRCEFLRIKINNVESMISAIGGNP